jgi:RHS repeat-associated protein
LTAGSGYSNLLTFSFPFPGGGPRNQPDGWCFDASGNLLAKSGACPPAAPHFVYDGENRMVSDPIDGATYVYDGNGTRVQKCMPNCTSPTSSTVFIFSGGKDIAEYDNGAAVTSPSRESIYSAGISGSGLLASISAGTITYFHSDHLDWRVSTDVNGNKNGEQGHYPFGESWYSLNGNEFVFTSYQRDAESGLDYAMARYYDSSAGRFCSADPVAGEASDPQTWNRYAYGRNDPIDKTDPSGKSWWSSLLIDIGIAVAAYFAPELVPALNGGGTAAAPFESVDATVAGVINNSTTVTVAATGPSIGTALIGGAMAEGLTPKPSKLCNNANAVNFVKSHQADAASVAKQLNVPTENVLGLSAHESQWGAGSFISRNGLGNAFFSEEGGSQPSLSNGAMHPTGNPAVTVWSFPSYLSSAQAFAARYGKVVNGITNPSQFASKLQKVGFNTGTTAGNGTPGWSDQVVRDIANTKTRMNCP